MCGIVGAAAQRPIANVLLEGLKRLEYRGYDSAGIAVLDGSVEPLKRVRMQGKVHDLELALQKTPVNGITGIAHTRWATHGVPSEKNAHPFVSHDAFALVHNGIVENHAILREQLKRDGYVFQSDTDTEVVVHLLHQYFEQHQDLLKAVYAVTQQLEGAFALGVIAKAFPNRLIGIRKGSPLVVGRGHQENFIASDPLALLTTTKEFIYLEDNDIADITPHAIHIYDAALNKSERKLHTLKLNAEATERGAHRHFMQKEIAEQAQAVRACLEGRIIKNHVLPGVFGHQAEAILPQISHIQLVACGTSYHAALVARYWLERYAGVPCSVEVASEFRYRHSAQPQNSLYVTLSQSGETADTLAALRLVKTMPYLSTLAICNVPNSTMMRESALHFLTHAGVEIGVASTKAFVTQLTALFLLTLLLRCQSVADHDETETAILTEALQNLPQHIEAALQQDQAIAAWATDFVHKQHALFLGRGALYPIALEGALKMKEISYIHAEGYPSGELKHGPLALVDPNMPVIAVAPNDDLIEKTLSNLNEIKTRGGKLYILTDDPARFQQDTFKDAKIITLPAIHAALNPILYTIPLQLLAYHVAVLKGTDVDQPRNLAKSVTVE